MRGVRFIVAAMMLSGGAVAQPALGADDCTLSGSMDTAQVMIGSNQVTWASSCERPQPPSMPQFPVVQGWQGLPSAQWFVGGRGNPQGVNCRTSIAIDGSQVASSPSGPVRLEGGLTGRWYTSQPSYLVTDQLAVDLTATPRKATIAFAVDCAEQGAASWSSPLIILPAPPAGREPGFSINDGATYTNSRAVSLFFGWEPSQVVGQVKVSNDGGFAPAQTRRADLPTANAGISWTLGDIGSERLPRTVYVRFGLFDMFYSQTYTDDIILDTIKPQVLSASLSGSGAASLASGRVVRIRAKDNRSGIASMQVSKGKPSKRAKVVKYRKAVKVAGSGPLFVRVRDGAGNWSKWRVAG